MLPPPYPCHLSPAPPHLAYTYRSRSLEEALVPCCLALSPPHPLTPPSSVCSSRSLEEALVHAFVEARRAAPALLFLPHLDGWWRTAPPPLRACLTQVRGCLLPPPPLCACLMLSSFGPDSSPPLVQLLDDQPPGLPLLLLATADSPAEQLEEELLSLFQ